MKEFKKACEHFKSASGLETAIIDASGEVIFRTASTCLYKISEMDDHVECKFMHLYAVSQAMRFGGRYVHLCHHGLAYLASPIMHGGDLQYGLLAGPFLLVDIEKYMEGNKGWKGDKENLRERLEDLTLLDPGKAYSFSELLYYSAAYLSALQEPLESPSHVAAVNFDEIQDRIGFYPLNKEDNLLQAMESGDSDEGKALLNDLMSYVYFYSGVRLDVIRSRVLELIVLLSRAAAKNGANPELIFGANYAYLKDISSFDNVKDLTAWLDTIMNRFADHMFRFTDAKHADVIFKAIEYIKLNYMKKIALEDVAGSVYLSPAYFSRVFKQETGHNFSSYLNKIRIDESKKLLRNASVNISDVAGMVGYEDQSYYSKVFKKIVGVSPLRFRQSQS